MAQNDFQYLSVGEAAVALKITEGRVRQLLLAGTLSGYKVGKHQWAIPQRAVTRRKNAMRSKNRG